MTSEARKRMFKILAKYAEIEGYIYKETLEMKQNIFIKYSVNNFFCFNNQEISAKLM